ncbi:MAG: hypothetical protein JRJ34_11980 [Deltaproteobacteria bacterium]|nr:hypothetical protein [Deltaproteobacteria bacterium]
MSKTTNIILSISIFLFLNTTLSLANGVVEFKYIFSDQFFSGENPLGKEIDPDLAKAKEAVITACKAWEAATGGSIKFIPANSPEEADIIFESRGPAFPSRMRSCVWMRTTSAIYFPNTCRKHSVSQYLTIAIQSVAFQNLGIRLTRIRITEPEYFFIKKQRRGFACWTKKRSRSMKPKGM